MSLTDRDLQTLRNLGNESEAAADEIQRLRAALTALRSALRKASGPMSYERWSTDFRRQVANALKVSRIS